MAIASVARKATIKRDDTLLKTQALVQRQKAVAQKLEQQQQVIEKDRQIAEDKQATDNMKLALQTGDIKNTKYAQDFTTLMDDFGNLNATDAPQSAKLKSIQELHNYTTVSNAAFEDIKGIIEGFTGTPEQRRHMNKDNVTADIAKYVGIENTTAYDFDADKLTQLIANKKENYNLPNIVEDFVKTQQEIVTTSLSSSNLYGDAQTKFTESKKAATFLVLNAAKDGYKMVDGKPVVVISDENLEAFDKYSKGATVAMDDYVKENTVDGVEPSRLEAMENVLRNGGAFNIDEETSITIRNKPVEKIVFDKKAAAAKVALGKRVAFITGAESNLVGNLMGQKGVVEKGQRTGKDGKPVGNMETTSSKKVKGGVEYTIVTDLRKLQKTSPEAIMVDINGDGEEEPVATITGTAPIIEIRKITVSDKDKGERGYTELNDYFNRTVPASQRIGADTFIDAVQTARKEAEAAAAAEAAAKAKDLENETPAMKALRKRMEELKNKK